MSILGRAFPGFAAWRDIHPALVHFPVALFPLALLAAALALRPARGARVSLPGGAFEAARLARLLLYTGTLGAVVAAATGLLAARSMAHGHGSVVAAHRAFMLSATGVAVLLSGWLLASRGTRSASRDRLLVVGLLILNGVMVPGADRGALVALRLRSGLGALPEVREAAEPGPAAAMSIPAHADPARGKTLFAALACGSCHDAPGRGEVPGVPPSLAFAGSRLRPEWVSSYLLAPARRRWADSDRRPVARMPDYHLAPGEAADLAAYLVTRTDSAAFRAAPVDLPPLTRQEAVRGRELFAEYACLGCHELGGAGSRLGPSLDGAGARLQAPYVYALLKDPRAVVPGTPMKNFQLWDQEARSLTAYLMTLR